MIRDFNFLKLRVILFLTSTQEVFIMKFFKCPECGTILIPDRSDNFEPKKLVELIPNTTDAAGEKHVPVITVDGSLVRVAVGAVQHPMLDAHFITFIVLETTHGYQKKDLKPGEAPEAVFALAEGEQVVAAYEYCNLHGLWKAEA